MGARHVIGRWSLFVSALVACTDGAGTRLPPTTSLDSSVEVPDAAAGTPDAERVAVCDQAVDGTPCGTGERHCIFGVCARNLCGDGVVAGTEECDDGNDMDGDLCRSDCKNTFICRDGRVDPGEECDDGNRVNDDGCSNSCQLVACGNGRTDPGEECDDGNRVDGDTCANTCKENVCGNTRVDPGEACDGNQGCSVAGQTCTADCKGCAQDFCGSCVERECSNVDEINVLAGCRVAVDPSAGESPMEGFIQKCSALDDCVRANKCTTGAGTFACFCGTLSATDCQKADQVDGPCAELYPPATACPPGEGLVNCVLNEFNNLGLPLGWSAYLAECRYARCATECGAR